MRSFAGLGCVLLFFLCWSGFVALFDVWMFDTISKQYVATRWPRSQGTVIEARIEEHRDAEDGTTYEPVLVYEYPVGSEMLRAGRVRFGNKSGSRNWAQDTVQRYAAGRPVEVYFNPENAAESLLEPGVTPGDVQFAYFILPFNFIALGVPLIVAIHTTLKLGPLGCPQWSEGTRSGLNFDYKNPVASAWVAGLCGSFLLIPINILIQVVLGSVGFVGLALQGIMLLASCAGAALWAVRRNARREQHVWVDARAQLVHLPGAGQFAWGAVRSFAFREEVTRDSDGDEQRAYHLQVLPVGNPPRDWRKTTSLEQAEAVTEWLKRQCDLAG
jgi:hypothetical protein